MKTYEWRIPLAAVLFLTAATAAFGSGDCSDYIDLTGQELPITTNSTTAGATNDYGPFTEQPTCWQGSWDEHCAESRDVTFKWTAPQTGRYTFTLVGTSAMADLLLFDFTCPAEPLYPGEFICGSHRCMQNCGAVRELEMTAGQEILIVVDGWFTWNGTFTLSIYDNTQLSNSVAMGMDLYHYPGLSAFTAWSGSGRWQVNSGLANIEENLPVDDDHLFIIYSVSKIVTGTALMQLWEDGHFDLDDDVAGYLTFPVRHPAYPEMPITFRMLLSHVAGIADNGLGAFVVDDGNDPPITPYEMMEGYFTPGEAYYDASENFTAEAPGMVWQYTNVGVTLAGCLVERINQESLTFADYCRAHIFDPLQMPASSFLLADINPEDLATHYKWIDPTYYPQPHVTASWYPAVALRTNAAELSRFLLAFMQDGELYGQRILDAATIDTMFTVHFPDVVSGDIGQGLIWRKEQIGDRLVWGHHGGADAARAAMWFSPDEGIGAIAISNCGGSAEFGGIHDIIDMQLRQAAYWTEAMVAVPDGLSATPAHSQLSQSFPNPFNPQTTIAFELPKREAVSLRVFDMAGRLVKGLIRGEEYTPGRHQIVWNGRDESGRMAASGAYFYRLETSSFSETKRMMLMR